MEKIKLLLYCNKSRPYLIGRKDAPYKYYLDKGGKDSVMDARDFIHNGKIIAECDFEVEEIRPFFHWCDKLEKSTGLKQDEVLDYLDNKDKSVGNPKRQNIVYLIHIKNLNIFDKAIPLTYYFKYNKQMKNILEKAKRCEYPDDEEIDKIIVDKAPQNMMYVYDCNAKEKYILISIRPEWLCKILNGEKTIECRKRILKEMI